MDTHTKRRAWSVAAGVVALSMVAGPALAHYVWESDFVWNKDNKCMKIKSEISHGNDLNFGSGGAGGYSKSEVWTMQGVPLPDAQACDIFPLPWDRPPGDIGTKIQLWRHNRFGWFLCRHTHWHYLANDGNHKTQEAYWQRPCNRGWYQTIAGGMVGYDGSKHRRFLKSGVHYLGPSVDGNAVPSAATGSASPTAIPPEPAQPAWVNPDGTVDVAAMPDLVPIWNGSANPQGYVRSADLMGPSDADLSVVDIAGRHIGRFTQAGFVPGR